MARIPYATPEEIARVMPMKMPAGPSNISGLMAQAPGNCRQLSEFLVSLLSQQQLAPRLRELCILYTAKLSNCTYEWTQHVSIAAATGVDEAEIAKIRTADMPEELFEEPARSALMLCRELVTIHSARGETVERAQKELGTRPRTELILAVVTCMGLSTCMNALDIEMEPARSASGAKSLIES